MEKSPADMNFGERLLWLCGKHGIDRAELHKKLRVSRGTVGHWFTGLHPPSEKNLRKLASFFDVSTEFLDKGIEPTQDYSLAIDVAGVILEIDKERNLGLSPDQLKRAIELGVDFCSATSRVDEPYLTKILLSLAAR